MLIAWSTIGWGSFLLAVVIPTVVLLARCIFDLQPPSDGFIFTARQVLLLAKTVGLAALAAALALVISIPAAYVVGHAGRPERRRWLSARLAAPLLFPPSVYVFGWQRVLPPGFPGWLECVGVWALWAYPIAALLIGTGWSRVGRGAYESALLEASPAAAFRRAALPLLSRHVALAALVLWVVFVSDYGVPHACGLAVYSTELLGWAANSTRTIDTLWLSAPAATIVLAGLVGVRWAWRRCAAVESDQPDITAVGGTVRGAGLAAGLCFMIAALVPLAALIHRLGSLAPLRIALETYGRELAGSLALATAAGLLTIVTGLCIWTSRRFHEKALLWMVAFGALPGALVGEALLATYRPVHFIYDAWPIVVLGYVARFGWVGALTVWLALRSVPEECIWQARTDGADDFNVAMRVRAAASWPTLLFGGCLAAALSLAEIPTSSLVQVPSLGLISQILVEKFHKAEDGMLISLSLWLVLAALPAAALMMVALKRRRGL